MEKGKIYQSILKNTHENSKMLGVLIDPDKQNFAELLKTIEICNTNAVDYIFIGGSIIKHGNFNNTARFIKENSIKPLVIFPGDSNQISKYADAILFLSLISGRNPDFLIGHHVKAAPILKETTMEVIPTGYLLINCGTTTAAIQVSKTTPIPYENSTLAANTALSGEYLGLKLTYLDGGSGAKQNISTEMIGKTKNMLKGPLIIGGGIRNSETAKAIYQAGADMIIIGNGVESNRNLIIEIVRIKEELNSI